MITYVDTSVLIKLIVEEEGSEAAARIWIASDALVAVRLVDVEARAALAAATRAGRLTAAAHRRAVRHADELLAQIDMVEITAEVVGGAGRLAEVHGLRGYDAVHLAGAIRARVDVFASSDVALCGAALREGIHVANPLR